MSLVRLGSFGHSYNQSLIPSTDMIQLTLTLKMTITQGSKTIFTDNNSPISRPSYPTYLLLGSNLSPRVDCFLLYMWVYFTLETLQHLYPSSRSGRTITLQGVWKEILEQEIYFLERVRTLFIK